MPWRVMLQSIQCHHVQGRLKGEPSFHFSRGWADVAILMQSNMTKRNDFFINEYDMILEIEILYFFRIAPATALLTTERKRIMLERPSSG